MSYTKQDFQFGNFGLTLVEGKNADEGGSNGSGKSSIWDGISWALFGQTVRGLKADEVINRLFKKDCLVSCEFEIKGREYCVNRSRKHHDSGDRFWIMDGSKKIEFGTVAQTQSWLEKELEIDFELFRCTVLFAQGETFNFVNETNKTQKDILSKVMRIDYAKHLQKAKSELDKKRSDVESKKSNLNILRSHLIKDVEEKFKVDVDAWESKRQASIFSLSSTLESLKAEVDQVRSGIKPLDKLIEVHAKMKEKISEMRAEVSTISSDISKNSGLISFWDKRAKTIAVGECSLCHQMVSEDHLCKEKDNSLKQCASLSKVVKELQEQKAEIEAKIEEARNKSEKVASTISEQNAKVNFLKHLEGNIRSTEASIANAEAEENPFIKKREEEIQRQKKIQGKIQSIEDEVRTLLEEIPYAEFWVNAFGDNGIKSFVFDLVCSTLTSKANMYLNTLSGGSVTVSFDTQKKLKTGEFREKFDCVVSSGSERVMYSAYSGGEKRRISLAVDMALSDLMSDYHHTKFNLAVFDEQDSFLDDQGRRQFLNLLKDIAKQKNVFVVAHDNVFKSMFDKVMIIEKRNGVSNVV